MAYMDYSLVNRPIDGTGKLLDTSPGSPDGGSYITEAQLRDWIRDKTIVKGYYYNAQFYVDALHTGLITPDTSSLYVDLTSDAIYRFNGSVYRMLFWNTYALKSDLAVVQADILALQAEDADLQSQIDAISGIVTDKGEVPTYADLPSSPSQGDRYWVEDVQKYYTWNGTAWVASGPGSPFVVRNGVLYQRIRRI